jgi:DNA modification methylase
VWTITLKPFKGAHFAVMPPELVRPCVRAGSRPGDVVLDPFGGSGTTALVALEEGRRAILCELNPQYAEMARGRVAKSLGLFAEVAT